MQVYNLMKMGLDATNLRGQTIANNIANINTPGYKRKYVTFEETLKKSSKGISIDDAKIELKVDNSTTMREDENNVDLEVEKVNQASNSLQYNALITLTSSKLAMAKSVIKG